MRTFKARWDLHMGNGGVHMRRHMGAHERISFGTHDGFFLDLFYCFT